MSDDVFVRLEAKDGVSVLTIDHPPVNALSPAVFRQLGEQLQAALADNATQAIVLIGKGKHFSAGFDLSTVGEKPDPEEMRKGNLDVKRMLEAYEDSPKPTIAAIRGTAFGGGLEVALACQYRLADATASLALPEVKVGLLPGGGGTQRLPRLVGLLDAFTMIGTGEPISSKKALEIGLVDELVEGDVLERAIAFAKEKAAAGTPGPKARDRSDKLPPADMHDQIFGFAKADLEKRAGHYTAPRKAFECIEVGVREGYEAGSAKELENFLACLTGPQSQALIHLFFAQRATTVIPGLEKFEKLAKPIAKVGVIGGGTMGRDIAFVHLISGKHVALLEAEQDRLDAAVEAIRGYFQRRVDRGKATQEKMDEAMSRLRPTLDYAPMGEMDLIIEAVFERMDVKKSVFEKLGAVVQRDTFVASNTSTLPISELASVIEGPERVIGLHYFSPARVMPLLEIIRTEQTSQETIATCLVLAKETKKTPILVGDCYGFLTNRVAFAYGAEANALLEEGASVQEIDEAVFEFGFPMGPFTMSDMAGNDIGYHAAPGMRAAYPKFSRPISPLSEKMFQAGRFGQKAGKGFYLYEGPEKKKADDPEFETMITDVRKEMGITPRTDMGKQEIVERIMYTWVNAAAHCLHEGIALKPSDVDIATVFGFGFPPFRGGLMNYAKQVGFDRIVARLEELQAKYGDIYEPSPWLREQVR